MEFDEFSHEILVLIQSACDEEGRVESLLLFQILGRFGPDCCKCDCTAQRACGSHGDGGARNARLPALGERSPAEMNAARTSHTSAPVLAGTAAPFRA